ncbi:hypothetical protein AGMMS49975_26780 [Clostridia bacterium]|nr:hypothetical protein AGMMS49975_26780 [Clostridia bacterium]
MSFPCFKPNTDLAVVYAYSHLVAAIRETATEKELEEGDSERFRGRRALLYIGLIGAQYRASRKILLLRLEGNGSWKKNDSADAVQAVEQ